ncbi:hypothetical protein GCM10018952_47210 [Streptosporangium vulgare]
MGFAISAIAALVRSLNIQADNRRREADLAAQLAHILLRTNDLKAALPTGLASPGTGSEGTEPGDPA